MEAFGASPDAIDEQCATEAKDALFDVHEDNVDTVLAFSALATQWRVTVGMSAIVYLGLDYSAITPLFLRSLGIARAQHADVFEGLRVMEVAALPLRNAKREDA